MRPSHCPCLQLLAVVRRVRKFNSDLPALLDEWASSLFREVRAAQAAWLAQLLALPENSCAEACWARSPVLSTPAPRAFPPCLLPPPAAGLPARGGQWRSLQAAV